MVISELGIPNNRLPEKKPERNKTLQGLLKWTPSPAKVVWPGGDPGLLTRNLLVGGLHNSEQPSIPQNTHTTPSHAYATRPLQLPGSRETAA